MNELIVEQCPETGICSLVREAGGKVDLLPDEVAALQEAGSVEDARAILAAGNPAFADELTAAEFAQIQSEIN